MKHGIKIILFGMLVLVAAPVKSGPPLRLAPARPGPGDKCPICGMFVAKYPDWVAQIRFGAGKTLFFDGAKDLFKYYFQLGQRLKRTESDIAAVYATDYYTLTPIDGVAAFYVVGSDVYGPMGRELVAFSSITNAQEFLRDHHGKKILRFDEITHELIATLD